MVNKCLLFDVFSTQIRWSGSQGVTRTVQSNKLLKDFAHYLFCVTWWLITFFLQLVIHCRVWTPCVVTNVGCVCALYWSIMGNKHLPEVRHFIPGLSTIPGSFLHRWLRGCFPAAREGFLFSWHCLHLVHASQLQALLTETVSWFQKMQKRKKNYRWFTWTSNISVTSWLLLNESKADGLIWPHTTHHCTCALTYIYNVLNLSPASYC